MFGKNPPRVYWKFTASGGLLSWLSPPIIIVDIVHPRTLMFRLGLLEASFRSSNSIIRQYGRPLLRATGSPLALSPPYRYQWRIQRNAPQAGTYTTSSSSSKVSDFDRDLESDSDVESSITVCSRSDSDSHYHRHYACYSRTLKTGTLPAA
jgi:hypothetical protein